MSVSLKKVFTPKMFPSIVPAIFYVLNNSEKLHREGLIDITTRFACSVLEADIDITKKVHKQAALLDDPEIIEAMIADRIRDRYMLLDFTDDDMEDFRAHHSDQVAEAAEKFVR
jgi:hypothetical protein